MAKEKEVETTFSIKKAFNIFVIIIFTLFVIGIFSNLINIIKKESVCGDGTLPKECSSRQPYFCFKGTLIEKAYTCDCPEVLTRNRDSCISKYQTKSKNITLKYTLRGEKKEMKFTVYKGMVEYISGLPKIIYHDKDEEISRQDYELGIIDEKEQRELLLPLVTKIQNIAENREDQVRIATSIVQTIQYEASEKTIPFGSIEVGYSRYPYEVLYEVKGVCEGKSKLLAFLLKEMGYGVILFYHSAENHISVGIKCPIKYSLNNTGYCFIETTAPAIISDNSMAYVGGIKLTSEPKIIFVSEGDSLKSNLYEYKDAKEMKKINEAIEQDSGFNGFELEKLQKKYSLANFYQIR